LKFDPEKHHRRSIRLQGYDYSRPGAYYVTIVTQNRLCLFGDVVDGNMGLNEAGQMVAKWYAELENKFPDVQCDAFVCMPNHVHFIVVKTDTDGNVGADLRVRPVDEDEGAHAGAPQHEGTGAPQRTPLSTIVQWLKTMSTNEYIRGVKQNGWPPFPGKLWQRNYYERIVRNDNELNRIRRYIDENPLRWELDQENPHSRL